VLALQGPDLAMITEVRNLLEMHAARRAAEVATPEMVTAIANCHRQHEAAVAAGQSGIGDDIVFHLKVAEAAGNKTLMGLMGLIGLFAADLIKLAADHSSCKGGRAEIAVAEHAAVLAAIERGNGDAAAAAMHHHIEESWIQFERTKPKRSEPAN
jgi:GntR family transcriptional regulator, transcriptional repressor for pyruvate dehydrogenase complex